MRSLIAAVAYRLQSFAPWLVLAHLEHSWRRLQLVEVHLARLKLSQTVEESFGSGEPRVFFAGVLAPWSQLRALVLGA